MNSGGADLDLLLEHPVAPGTRSTEECCGCGESVLAECPTEEKIVHIVQKVREKSREHRLFVGIDQRSGGCPGSPGRSVQVSCWEFRVLGSSQMNTYRGVEAGCTSKEGLLS